MIKDENRGVNKGFTLIEIVVVLFIITIIISFTTISIINRDRNLINDEIKKLSLLINHAQQQSILAGTVLAVKFNENGYDFYYLSKSLFETLDGDEILKSRKFPEGMRITDISVQGSNDNSALIFNPSGMLQNFEVIISKGNLHMKIYNDETGIFHIININA